MPMMTRGESEILQWALTYHELERVGASEAAQAAALKKMRAACSEHLVTVARNIAAHINRQVEANRMEEDARAGQRA
jgi:hypothetical protein